MRRRPNVKSGVGINGQVNDEVNDLEWRGVSQAGVTVVVAVAVGENFLGVERSCGCKA